MNVLVTRTNERMNSTPHSFEWDLSEKFQILMKLTQNAVDRSLCSRMRSAQPNNHWPMAIGNKFDACKEDLSPRNRRVTVYSTRKLRGNPRKRLAGSSERTSSSRNKDQLDEHAVHCERPHLPIWMELFAYNAIEIIIKITSLDTDWIRQDHGTERVGNFIF